MARVHPLVHRADVEVRADRAQVEIEVARSLRAIDGHEDAVFVEERRQLGCGEYVRRARSDVAEVRELGQGQSFLLAPAKRLQPAVLS